VSPPAPLAVVLVHGRGRIPEEMIDLFARIDPGGTVVVAPGAPDASWYPLRFTDPGALEQPELDAALARIDQEVRALEAQGFTRDRIAILGFSQGACLASEYVYRNPGRWAALVAFTGGLIGPEGTHWDRAVKLEGTPILLSSGDTDPWVPGSRIEETAAALRAMGGEVTLKMYPGDDHVVRDDEIAAARMLLGRIGASAD
jgi:phospholipase/carboxylesterase